MGYGAGGAPRGGEKSDRGIAGGVGAPPGGGCGALLASSASSPAAAIGGGGGGGIGAMGGIMDI